MVSKALGLIEVKGLLSAMVAMDAALKASDVKLIGNQTIRGGLTTVELFGDVAAIQSAVEAGVNALTNTNSLISSHVIARLDEQVEQMIMKSFENKETLNNFIKEEQAPEHVMEEAKEEIESEEMQKAPEATLKENTLETETTQEMSEVNDQVTYSTPLTREELWSLKVTQLRTLAYKNNVAGIEKAEIKFATKEKLIDILSAEGGIDE